MKEKKFGELNIGDKIYAFNANTKDNCIIKEVTIYSITLPLIFLLRTDGFLNKIQITDYGLNIFEKNGIIYATSKSLIFEYLKSRCEIVKSNINYYKKKIKLLEKEISECEGNVEHYEKENGKLLSFIGRLKDRYYL
jgi:hypothetical protein